MDEKEKTSWVSCKDCQGLGKKRKRPSKKSRLRFRNAISDFQKAKKDTPNFIRPQEQFYSCSNCNGSGLIITSKTPKALQNYPHIAIVGAGIGGVALAVACWHRQIPFTLYDRDSSFDDRSQGYGLTLQQASIAMKGLGICSLANGVISTKHIVHNTEGKVIGEWGKRKWVSSDSEKPPKRTNVHIARQSLRLELLEQLPSKKIVKWGHQLINFQENDQQNIDLRFRVNGEIKKTQADLIVGADGIRSTVRKMLIGEGKSPLRYLDCIVILGICPLSALDDIESPLLDSATVFQTANGNERIYMMPYAKDAIMWQLSFLLPESEAKALSAQGAKALKEEACRRTQWHSPIPQILAATHESQISGYPVYDRALLRPEWLEKGKKVTLIGDAAHPMSPFKGQGANQALLDALDLARLISTECKQTSDWKEIGIRESVLTKFESKMINRSTSKVKSSAEAAKVLHSDAVLYEGNKTRGHCAQKNLK